MRRLAALFALIASVVAVPALAQTAPNASPATSGTAVTSDTQNLWLLDLSTGGRVTIWLRPDVAPKMVERIKTLTREHFYDGLLFHRVIDGFMAQGGDPKGDGTGGSKLPDVAAEFNYLPHVRGAVSAARSDKEDSANSQFFIVFQPKLSLDKKYTVFGRVVDGMQYVDRIERGEPPQAPSRIVHAYIASDNPPAYQPMAPTVAPAGALGAPVTLGAPTKAPAKPMPAKKAPARKSN